jgi:hypothetical protein
MKRLLAILAAFLFAGIASADGAKVFRAHGSGELVIEPDGSVGALSINERFGKDIDPILDARIRAWRFEPILEDGKPVRAKAHFLIDLQADVGPEGAGQFRITDTRFVDPPATGARQSTGGIEPPRYPVNAMRRGYGAHVNLLARIDGQGKVIDISGQDSWLTSRDNDLKPEHTLRMLAEFIAASEKAVRQWDMRVAAEAGKQIVHVPITFTLETRSPWRRAHFVSVEKAPWAAKTEAQSLAMLSPGGGLSRDDIRLLDSPDPE